MGYGSFPKSQRERELDLDARASDREREMAHVADRVPGQDGPNLFARIVGALRRLHPRPRS